MGPKFFPQSNPTERINRVVKVMISSYIGDHKDHREWDKYLPKLGFAIRSAVHEVTGHTPNYLNFGRELLISGTQHSINNDLHTLDISSRSELLTHLNNLPAIFLDVQKRLDKAYFKSASRFNQHRTQQKIPPE